VKLSSKGRYGVRAVFDIAFHDDGKATQIKDIAERQAIPARFLEQIFQDLKRAGIVTSKRGPRGGYQLAREPKQLTLGDVIRALEGPIDLASPEIGESAAPDDAVPSVMLGRDPTSLTVTEQAFRELGEQIEAVFDAMNIGELVARGEALGIRRRLPGQNVYVI
jgi:Rrf2 family transcriptional regulator, iron-sulfur cluster assembly transcription factor